MRVEDFKLPECEDCGNPKIEANGLCASCASRRRKEARLDAQNALKKPSGLKRPTKPIRRRSEKETARMVEYNLKKTKFLLGRSCAVCGAKATTVHHKAGRIGDLLLDESLWLPTCMPCHILITEDSAWAIREGYSVLRNT